MCGGYRSRNMYAHAALYCVPQLAAVCVQCWTVLTDGCSFMFSILSGFYLRDAMLAQVLSMALCLSVGPSQVGVL